MWLIADTPVTVRTAHGDMKLTPGIPIELSDALGERVLQCAGDRVRMHAQDSAETIFIDPPLSHAKPVYWERGSTGDILGPAMPEFLAMAGRSPKASYWVVALYEGRPLWINSDQLRSKRQCEQQVKLKVVELIREPRGRISPARS